MLKGNLVLPTRNSFIEKSVQSLVNDPPYWFSNAVAETISGTSADIISWNTIARRSRAFQSQNSVAQLIKSLCGCVIAQSKNELTDSQ